MNKLKDTKGITLIALIITIIVLLILAGITIAQITGQDSSMEKASQAKIENDIGADKDQISLAYVSAMAETENASKVEVADLRKQLQKSYGTSNVIVSQCNKTDGTTGKKVYLKESDRYYFVDNNGNVTNVTKEDLGYKPAQDVYAALYKLDGSSNDEDLELVFYSLENGEKPSSLATKTLVAPTDANLGWNISNEITTSDADSIPWYNSVSQIKEATFENEVIPVYTRNWFVYCSALEKINDINNLNTCNVLTMRSMFFGCSSLEELDVSNFDTSNVTDMYSMFCLCLKLKELDVSNFDTSNVTDMCGMFYSCLSLKELDVSNFDTSNVTDMNSMFCLCLKLKELDVSNFDTSNVTIMYQMFAGNSGYGDMQLEKIIGIENFDTRNVENMAGMFQRCSSITELDLSGFNTSNVDTMQAMFLNCHLLKNIKGLSDFDTAGLSTMNGMFNKCYNLSGEITLKCDITVNSKNRNAFNSVATQNNAKFTVKYTSNVSASMLNNIRSTMTNGENVEFIAI